MRPLYHDKLTKDLRKHPDVQTGIRFTLLDMLYDGKITIPEFKEYCLESGLDYENIEHCCGCAGCYESTEESICPDYESPDCKIEEPKYCHICGQRAKTGYPLTDKNDKLVYTFWTCEIHSNNKKIERALRRGTSIEYIVQEWNK